MRLLALNLPQFHEIPENDEWWGKGFTEWNNVKGAKPLFEGHVQPMVPQEGYYDLSRREDVAHQCELARKFGLSGFIYYHYWFNGKMLLEKPCELLLDMPDVDVEYCFCWANEPWARTWDGKPGNVLMPQTFGGEKDWEAHINYLEGFFKDPRYIKVGNQPVLYVYSPSSIPDFDSMVEYWNKHVKKIGFDGVYLVEFLSTKNPDAFSEHSQAVMEFEPLYTTRFGISAVNKARRIIAKKTGNIDFQNFDALWNDIINRKRTYGGRSIQKSGFSGWDNSPRKGRASMIVRGATPEKFGAYLSKLLEQERADASNDFIVINAWNEWGEGAMLEPTVQLGYRYLEAVKNALQSFVGKGDLA